MGKNKKEKKLQIQQKRQQRKQQRQLLKKMRKKMNKQKGDTFKLTKQYIQYFDKISKQLDVLRIKMKDTKGDGNCLFRSIADQLDGTQNTYLYLREQACKFILNNQEFFSNFIDEEQEGNIFQYVQNMRKDGQWGGHLQLQALSQCLRCIIVIHKINHQQYYVTPIITQASGTILHLAYFQHEDFQHYLSIRDIDDNSQDPAIHKLKALNLNMYKHLMQLVDPQQLALMKQIQQMELNDYLDNYGNQGQYQGQYQQNQYQNYKEVKKQIKQPYPGLPANKKCKCGSAQTYKNCCLKQYHKKKAKQGYY